MAKTNLLADAGSGNELTAVHGGLSPTGNATGWRMALDKQAARVEMSGRESSS